MQKKGVVKAFFLIFVTTCRGARQINTQIVKRIFPHNSKPAASSREDSDTSPNPISRCLTFGRFNNSAQYILDGTIFCFRRLVSSTFHVCSLHFLVVLSLQEAEISFLWNKVWLLIVYKRCI